MRYGSEAQLLVVGSHGHGGFAGMLLGSTRQALVYNACRARWRSDRVLLVAVYYRTNLTFRLAMTG